jgi:hypothetical protein
VTGSEFIKQLVAKGVTDSDQAPRREAEALEELLAGNVPRFLQRLSNFAVELNPFKDKKADIHTGKVFISPDYLAIGTDDDFVRFPLTPIGAQVVHDGFETTFPTMKICNLIFEKAGQAGKGKRIALTGLDGSRKTADYLKSNEIIEKHSPPRDQIVAGHKKDILLHSDIAKKVNFGTTRPLVIYGGWDGKGTRADNWFVQDPNIAHHDDGYEDYSHAIRLVSRKMEVDGGQMDVHDVLRKELLYGLLYDGPFIPNYPLRYPGAPKRP